MTENSQRVFDSTSNLYTSKGDSFPPAEKYDRVLRLELTSGCTYGACNFCDLYDKKTTVKDLNQYLEHLNEVLDGVANIEGTLGNLERVFIGSGNALSVETQYLNDIIKKTISIFKEQVGEVPRRLAMYGNTRDILAKGLEELKYLRCGGTCEGNCSKDLYGEKKGLDILYWGVESGSPRVLKYVNKGYDYHDIIEAAEMLKRADIRTSVMVMPGLGGIELADSHSVATIDVLNHIQPKYITFMAINPKKGSKYAQKMEEDTRKGINRPLNSKEIQDQTQEMINGLEFKTTVGCFDNSVDKISANPNPFGSFQTNYRPKINSAVIIFDENDTTPRIIRF